MGTQLKPQRQVAREILEEVGATNVNSTAVFLNQILQGKKQMPEKWVAPILAAYGLKELDELRVHYPKLVACPKLHKVAVSVSLDTPDTEVSLDDLQALRITANTLRDRFGIRLKITVSL